MTPEQAIREAKLTREVLKGDGRQPTVAASRAPEQVRRDIEAEREQLVQAVDQLRAEITGIEGEIAPEAPVFGCGRTRQPDSSSPGGVGATVRLLARRSREGREKARFGRFSPCRPRLATARQ